MLPKEVFKTLHQFVKDKIECDSREKSFNILRAAVKTQLRETVHSRILANLLQYDTEILNSFLNKFFSGEYLPNEDLPNKDFKKEGWNIFVEKNKMDIVLEGKFHGNVIIIENKVNDACEQPEQIDRYVSHYREKNDYENIYVLYLKREDHYGPSPYSWSKTDGDCKLITISYKDDVRSWIDELTGDHSKKAGLAATLRPYKEYLDMMFNKDTEIMEEAKNKIKELLEIEETAEKAAENAALLEKTESEFKLLMEACRSLRYECKWKEIQQRINKDLTEKKGLPELTDMQKEGWDLPDAGIPFRLQGHETQFYAVVSYLNECYIGIINFSQAKENDEDFSSIFKNMLGNLSNRHYSTIRYPIWFKIEEGKDLVGYYLKMIDILEQKSKGENPKVIELGKDANNEGK